MAHTPAPQKAATDLGWSCMCSFVLIAVTGSISLFLALTTFGHGQGSGPELHLGAHLLDLSSITRPSSARNTLDNAEGFFFEIGTGRESLIRSARGSMRTRHLEKKGWTGVCAVAFPGDFSDRTCKVVALPVSGASGEKVLVSKCPKPLPWSFTKIISTFNAKTKKCPKVEANTIGIGDLLAVGAAPPVIDYIALNTDGSELDILKNFPFDDFCVRAWTIHHNYQPEAMPKIRHILEVAHGCRVREGAGEYWARCTCQTNTGTKSSGDIGATSGAASLVLLADGHASARAEQGR